MAPFKLYYTPTSCGAASYIVATMCGLNFDSEQVNIGTKVTASGADFRKINSKGNVPTVVLADGTTLNENIATLTYIADQNTAAGLVPPPGTKRYVYLNALGFVNSELHLAFGRLFNPNLDEAGRDVGKKAALAKLKYFTDIILNGNRYALGGDKPTAVDIYAYIVMTWSKYLNVDISVNPIAVDFVDRVSSLPEVKSAHAKMKSASAAK